VDPAIIPGRQIYESHFEFRKWWYAWVPKPQGMQKDKVSRRRDPIPDASRGDFAV
jgi:hypothetical protein